MPFRQRLQEITSPALTIEAILVYASEETGVVCLATAEKEKPHDDRRPCQPL